MFGTAKQLFPNVAIRMTWVKNINQSSFEWRKNAF
jgi:hypothetical protein